MQPITVKIKHVCSTTQLLAPTVDDELEFSLSHMHGEPASVVTFPQFTDSLGNSSSPDYCGPRKYTVTTGDEKEVLEVVLLGDPNAEFLSVHDVTARFIAWPDDIFVPDEFPFSTFSEPSDDFVESEVINTANPGQE